MPKFITTYNGSGAGVFYSETRDQAINTAFETLKALLGQTPDRRLINAWPTKQPKNKTQHHENKPTQKLPTQGRLFP
jgi:hypothetical protein